MIRGGDAYSQSPNWAPNPASKTSHPERPIPSTYAHTARENAEASRGRETRLRNYIYATWVNLNNATGITTLACNQFDVIRLSSVATIWRSVEVIYLLYNLYAIKTRPALYRRPLITPCARAKFWKSPDTRKSYEGARRVVIPHVRQRRPLPTALSPSL